MSRSRKKGRQQPNKANHSIVGQGHSDYMEEETQHLHTDAMGSSGAREIEGSGTDDRQSTQEDMAESCAYSESDMDRGSAIKRICQGWKAKTTQETRTQAGERGGKPSIPKTLLAILAMAFLLGLAFFLVSGQLSSPPQTADDIDRGPFSSDSLEKATVSAEKLSIIEVPVPLPAAEPEIEPTPDLSCPAPNYKMAYMGQEEAESFNDEGLDETLYRLNSSGFKDVNFYAVAFAVELGAENGQEMLGIRVEDKASGAYLSATPHTVLHVYKSIIPTEEHLSAHPQPDVPAKSVAAASYIAACTFVSLEKYSYDDISIIMTYRDGDGEHECQLEVNASMDDISMPVSYSVGNGLIKLGNHYYVVEDRNGTGSSESTVYYFRDIRCVSRPLLGHMTGLEQGVDVRLVDDTSGELVELPAGLDLFLREDSIGFPSVSTISIGISSTKSIAIANSVLTVSSPCIRLGHNYILL